MIDAALSRRAEELSAGRVPFVASTLSLERDGHTFYFCSEGCRARFEAHKEHVPTVG